MWRGCGKYAWVWGMVVMGLLPWVLFAQEASHPNDVLRQEVVFLPQGGFYTDSVEVRLSHPSRRARIHYTLDGSEPNQKSRRFFKSPITLKRTTVIRAVAYHGRDTSRLESSTYFVNEPKTDWLVVSLAIPPRMLFDSVVGLFELGVYNKLDGLGNYGANYWTRREYPLNVEIFEADSSCVYRSPSGFRLFGGMSRTFPQKSLSLISRKRYGNKRFRHRFFEQTDLGKYKYLLLRNAGSDWNRAHGRDVIINAVVEDWDILKQAQRPCHVYLNGEYWGIYYLREKINAYFIASHHKGVDPDSIDLIEHRQAVRKGSRAGYERMLQFMREEDMSDASNYAFLQSLMNTVNFADYKLIQIFMDNVDAGGNIKFWRSDDYDNGRWNWILYDTDWGMGLMKYNAYEHNSLAFHTRADGPDWPNPPWSTFMLRKLLENKEFEQMFLNRFCDRLNTDFRTDSLWSKIKTHQRLMAPEMPRQFERWGGNERVWGIHYNRMVRFAEQRPAIIWRQLMRRFDTGGRVQVRVTAEGRGSVRLNDNLKISHKRPFWGHYFEEIPISLLAQARLGYAFSHWEGSGETSPNLQVSLAGLDSVHYHAVFVPIHTHLQDSVLFNEVSIYNQQTGDWMELYNATPHNINISGWHVKNKKKEFELPSYWLAPHDYVVLARDTARFLQVFPMYRSKVIGDFNFGLDRESDRLELFDRRGATVDTFSYGITTPGSDFTLDLKAPFLDNGDSSNWEINYGRGSPNAINPSYLFELTRDAQIRWVLVGLLAGMAWIGLIAWRTLRQPKQQGRGGLNGKKLG